LTEEDRDNIQAFKLKMLSNMPCRVYNQMHYSFRHKITINSEWVILHRLTLLAGIEPLIINCCVKSCIAYTRQYIHHEECPYCKEPRYTRSRKPRRTFAYLPLIPRLKAFFQSVETTQKLLYRHQFEYQRGIIHDAFDAEWYQMLQKTKVEVDGIPRQHNYFHGKYDIAMGLSVDGYLLF
ncbi:hypothetical protein BDN67DRAFT_874805, partial [Paxillus ammoniavirescens]